MQRRRPSISQTPPADRRRRTPAIRSPRASDAVRSRSFIAARAHLHLQVDSHCRRRIQPRCSRAECVRHRLQQARRRRKARAQVQESRLISCATLAECTTVMATGRVQARRRRRECRRSLKSSRLCFAQIALGKQRVHCARCSFRLLQSNLTMSPTLAERCNFCASYQPPLFRIYCAHFSCAVVSHSSQSKRALSGGETPLIVAFYERRRSPESN